MNAVWAQFDIRLTAAYGSMVLNPRTNLDMHINPENFLTAGLQADYYLSDNFGVGLGADYYILDCVYNVILTDYSHSYNGVDNWEGDPVPRNYEFTIRSNVPDIVEQNTMSFVDIPVSAIYNIPLIKNIKLATRVGFKMGIPLNDTYILKSSDLYTRLYFPEWDLELFNIPAHGLYDSRIDWHPEGKLNLNYVYSAFSEIGLDFPVSLLKVRISGYFSYGLNNIISKKESSLIYWREDYNPILSLAESVNIVQYGIKVGVGYNKAYKKKSMFSKRTRRVCPWEY